METDDLIDPEDARAATVYEAGIVGLLGLLGAGLAIASTAQPAAPTPIELAGVLVGLLLAFVGAAGVVHTVRG